METNWITNTELLVNALNKLVNIVEKTTSMPISQNVKIDISGNSMHLTTTDSKLEIQSSLPLSGDQEFHQPFSTTVSAKKLLDSCNSAQEEIVFTAKDGQLLLSFDKGSFKLLTQSAETFPVIEMPDTDSDITLPQRIWKELIDATAFAISTGEEPRIALTGLLIDVVQIEERTVIRLVGANGPRMAIAETDSTSTGDALTPESIRQEILPRKAVLEMKRLLTADTDMNLTLSFNSNTHVVFRLEDNDLIFSSPLIEGDYPEYNNIMPLEEDNQGNLLIAREEFSESLKNVVVVQQESPKTVDLTFSSEELTLASQNGETEEGILRLPCQYTGNPAKFSYNEQYLRDALKIIASDQVNIKVGNDGSLILEDIGEVRKTSLIMPLDS